MSTTKIKICGLFRPCDAESVNAAMPDYAGFVFYEPSRRNLSQEQARALRQALHPAIATVGVFVDAPPEMIAGLCREKIVSVVQLHGSESEEYIAALRALLPGTEIWKAFKIRSASDMEAAAASTADRVLLDNGCGTGEGFDWSLTDGFSRPFVLAGGLTPESIPDAIRRVHPYAVDLSSGVETDGRKDKGKIFAAVAAARSMERREEP